MNTDSIPARMAELNKTLEHMNRLFDLAGNATAGSVAAEACCVSAEIRRLSNAPLPPAAAASIPAPGSPLPAPCSAP